MCRGCHTFLSFCITEINTLNIVVMPAEVPIPYTSIGKPITEFVEYNNANFSTTTWKVPSNVEYKGKIFYVHGFMESASIYTEFLTTYLKMVMKCFSLTKEALVRHHQMTWEELMSFTLLTIWISFSSAAWMHVVILRKSIF